MVNKDELLNSNHDMEQEKITPMMEQYNSIKRQHPDKILLFRLGDFFEIFGQDAVVSAKILHIQLTSRSKDKKNAIPMCGVPAQAVENYIHKLILAGKKLVICDQVDGALQKGLVKREVVQIVTPGTFFGENLLGHESFNYLAALHYDKKNTQLGFAVCDLSTGALLFEDLSGADITQKLFDLCSTYQPKEFLVSGDYKSSLNEFLNDLLLSLANQFFAGKKDFIEFCPANYFNIELVETSITTHYRASSLDSLRLSKKDPSTVAVGALIKYLKKSQFSDLKHLEIPTPISDSVRMWIDEGTIRNLEFFYDSQGDSSKSLYHVLNMTETPMGARSLIKLMQRPFVDRMIINNRLSAVAELIEKSDTHSKLIKILKTIGDLERTASRLSLPNLSIVYLIRLKNGLMFLRDLHNFFLTFKSDFLVNLTADFDVLSDIWENLDFFLPDKLPDDKEDKYPIRDSASKELAEKRMIVKDVKSYIAAFENEQRKKTGINNLKVGYNRIFGYYIEVSHSAKFNIPTEYIRKQTLAKAERFTTNDLQLLEEKIANVKSDIMALEEQIYYQLCQSLLGHISRIKKTATLIGTFDVLLSFARVAELRNYCRPNVYDAEYSSLKIKNARHPVLETLPVVNSFTPNDLELDNKNRQILVITGPNMGGKSTFMRQSAIACYMAQLGCYVAASALDMTVMDRIFTRVGAADNLTKGKSTFMVEMSEMALITKQASAKSFIILDEIGRGTSTFDGIGIAWAIIEYLDKLNALTLFATHYYELTKLKSTSKKIDNCHVHVSDRERQLIFTHKILPGPSDKSYGIQVARLAGLPDSVLRRAQEIFSKFEHQDRLFLDDKLIKYNNINPAAKDQDSVSELGNLSPKKADLIYEKFLQFKLEENSPLDCFKFLEKLKKHL